MSSDLAAEEGGRVLRGELGDVHMGAAFAVLPDASRVPITLEPTDGGFHFLVPAEGVASSEGLVVIDPLITSQVLTVSSATDATVESAAYGDEFRIVIERIFSNNDHDDDGSAIPNHRRKPLALVFAYVLFLPHQMHALRSFHRVACRPHAMVALSSLCAGDGLAEVVGRRIGKHKLPWNKGKSWEGSAACVTGAYAASNALLHWNR